MPDQFSRTQLLMGKDALETLRGTRVIVFGIGGVGGFTVEALARAGIGAIEIVDDDKVCLTNLNRQIIALHSTIGKYKVDVMSDRIHDINPSCEVVKHQCFFLPETADQFDFSKYRYVVDAVDTVAAKISIIEKAKAAGVPVISCMGAGNKLDPSLFRIADIAQTSVCPLARVMRQELKKRGITGVKVLYSVEKPVEPVDDAAASCRTHCVCPPGAAHKCTERRAIPGSTSFVPSVAGLLIAGEVIKDITGIRGKGC
jgi:tRNA A37 threonylcarbamoyladenosine dehydratase